MKCEITKNELKELREFIGSEAIVLDPNQVNVHWPIEHDAAPRVDLRLSKGQYENRKFFLITFDLVDHD